MKKKIILALVAAVVAVFACFAFAACSGDGDLQMNARYIIEDDINEKDYQQTYFEFFSDGTGVYRYYYKGTSTLYDYELTFKYTYADNDKSAVVCFYDSVVYGKDNITAKVSTEWMRLLTVSKNVLCYVSTSGYTYYINQNYLNSTLQNFGK